MSPELPPPAEAAPAPRRSWPQRTLLVAGALLSVAALAAAMVVGWGAWKLRSIDRADVALDALIADGPANYLIVGSDSRRGGDPLDPAAPDDHAPLADTILLVRVDPATRQARVLSLPRDLWVTLASTGKKGRINGAYAGGPQELVDTLRAELHVTINHYVEVDFGGFQEIVSAVDGVPMWFDRAMRDRNTGLDVLHPGCVVLDGRAALAFARSRHLQYFSNGGFAYDGTGDLGRISRQQLFLRRVIDRVKAKGVRNPLTLKRLVDVGTANVTIDAGLTVSDLAALGRQFSSFDSSALQTYTLPNTARTTDGGAAVVQLDRAAAAPVLALFRATARDTAAAGAGGSTTEPDPQPLPSEVAATVLNSSGRQGLAVRAADQLVAAGFRVDHFGNGVELDHPTEPTTVVRYAPGSEAPARAVASHVAGSATVERDRSLDRGSVVLFLGADFTGIKTARAADPQPPAGSNPSGPSAAPAPTPSSKVVGVVPGDPPAGKTCV